MADHRTPISVFNQPISGIWKLDKKRPVGASEAWVKAQIKAMLKHYNIWYFMPAGTGLGMPGIPDFVGCYHGFFLAIEAKREGGYLSKWQDLQLEALENANAFACVVDEWGLDALSAHINYWCGMCRYKLKEFDLPTEFLDFRGANK